MRLRLLPACLIVSSLSVRIDDVDLDDQNPQDCEIPLAQTFCAGFVKKCSKDCRELSACCEEPFVAPKRTHAESLNLSSPKFENALGNLNDASYCFNQETLWQHIRQKRLCPVLQSSVDHLLSQDGRHQLEPTIGTYLESDLIGTHFHRTVKSDYRIALPKPAQGYKLHIVGSMDVLSHILVSCSVANYLHFKKVQWKFFHPLGIVELALLDPTSIQKYKIITIYPPKDDIKCTERESGIKVDSCPNAKAAFEIASSIDELLRACETSYGLLRSMNANELSYIATLKPGNTSEQHFKPGSWITYRYGQLSASTNTELGEEELLPVNMKGKPAGSKVVADDRSRWPSFVSWSLDDAAKAQ